MNYGAIRRESVVDGPGVRVSLFVSGCPHRCPGCFNQELWNYNAGDPFTFADELMVMKAAEPGYIAGLSVLGGEPLAPWNRGEVLSLCHHFKKRFPNKTIWLFTGYTWDTVKDFPGIDVVDVIVDGRFIEAEKDLTLRFRGSRNQRIIDVKKSKNKLTLWKEDQYEI